MNSPELSKPSKSKEQKRIDKALNLIVRYGSIDGSHHKDWVLDQVTRALLGTKKDYEKFVKEACDGEEGPNTYYWEVGIAP